MTRSGAEREACPCGSGRTYAACCGRFHDGPARGLAPTAEALMRSRYSAYVLDRDDVLLDTWHPSTRPAAIEPRPPGLRWLGLTMRRHEPTGTDTATVEFVAVSKLGGRADRMVEKSRFVRVAGRWFYLDAAG
jgi:SEC-C motif-containing protein